MRVKDVMTRMIVSVSPQASVAEAIRLMVKRHVSGLPVIDEAGTLVGVLSEGDLLRRIEIGTSKPVHWLEYLSRPGHLAEVYKQTHGRKVEEIMSTNVSTIDQNLPLEFRRFPDGETSCQAPTCHGWREARRHHHPRRFHPGFGELRERILMTSFPARTWKSANPS